MRDICIPGEARKELQFHLNREYRDKYPYVAYMSAQLNISKAKRDYLNKVLYSEGEPCGMVHWVEANQANWQCKLKDGHDGPHIDSNDLKWFSNFQP